jgi:hypothetical protein
MVEVSTTFENLINMLRYLSGIEIHQDEARVQRKFGVGRLMLF